MNAASYFVNRCYRHHNIDGPEVFTTRIPSAGESTIEAGRGDVSLIETIANWALGLKGPTKLIDSREPTKDCLSTGLD